MFLLYLINSEFSCCNCFGKFSWTVFRPVYLQQTICILFFLRYLNISLDETTACLTLLGLLIFLFLDVGTLTTCFRIMRQKMENQLF